ncbi:MAG TPA: L-seryl-tRNA(Sec) selenium transferase [Kofleriaceae bacterium]
MAEARELLRRLPKIDDLLRRDEAQGLTAPRWAVLEALRGEVEALRQGILSGGSARVEVDWAGVRHRAAELARPSLRRVINATGVVLHTNLGRAPVAPAALEEAAAIARGYCNLEYEVAEGRRGSRHSHLEAVLRELTGAEAAAVVNNNAAAVMLCLSALASGREVVVSRGELIEIGGSFRIPDVMRLSGARLVEVGTTNKTHAADYERAIGPDTALLLKVHRSNFHMVGFTAEVELGDLVALGRARGVPTMMDLGSGCLLPPAEVAALGLPAEPDVRGAVASGVDLVSFSGDKLLGGPQAGVIAGRAAAVALAKKHPLMRAVRPDKLTIAALHATLRLHRDGRGGEVPIIAMLRASGDELRARAEELAKRIRVASNGAAAIEVIACRSAIGGGALPDAELESWAVAIAGPPPDQLDAALRAGEVAVVGRIAEDRLLLDVRTLLADDLVPCGEAAVHALRGAG